MSEPSSCRFRCCSFIFSLGLSALFLWLSLRPSKPTFSIESFYVPALNKTASADQRRNTTLVFDLLLKNRNKDSGVFYDQLNLTVYHGGNLALPVANLTIPAFRQGKKKKAHRVENVTAVGVPWEEARRAAAAAAAGGGGGAVFGVGVATAVRYRIVFWKTRRYGMSLAGNVTVNDLGVKSTEGGVKLSSSSSSLHVGVVVMVVLGIFVNSLFSF